MKHLARLHDVSSRALFTLAGLALGLACLLYLFKVAARYLLNAPTTWSGEAVQYALAALIFLALPDITRRQGHIAIDVVISTMPDPWADRMGRIMDWIGALACACAAWIVFSELMVQFERGLMTNAAHPIPRWWITSLIFAGLASAALHFARHGLKRS